MTDPATTRSNSVNKWRGLRSQLKATRDGDAFTVRLTPRQASAMYEALSYLRRRDSRDTELTLLVGAGRRRSTRSWNVWPDGTWSHATSGSPSKSSIWCTAR